MHRAASILTDSDLDGLIKNPEDQCRWAKLDAALRPKLLGLARRLLRSVMTSQDADDVVQDAVIEFANMLANGAVLNERETVPGLLATIVRRRVGHLRRRNPIVRRTWNQYPAPPQENYIFAAAERAADAAVEEFVNSFSPEERDLYELLVSDCRVEDVAKGLKLGRSTVFRRIDDLRRKARRDYLEQSGK